MNLSEGDMLEYLYEGADLDYKCPQRFFIYVGKTEERIICFWPYPDCSDMSSWSKKEFDEVLKRSRKL